MWEMQSDDDKQGLKGIVVTAECVLEIEIFFSCGLPWFKVKYA